MGSPRPPLGSDPTSWSHVSNVSQCLGRDVWMAEVVDALAVATGASGEPTADAEVAEESVGIMCSRVLPIVCAAATSTDTEALASLQHEARGNPHVVRFVCEAAPPDAVNALLCRAATGRVGLF